MEIEEDIDSSLMDEDFDMLSMDTLILDSTFPVFACDLYLRIGLSI